MDDLFSQLASVLRERLSIIGDAHSRHDPIAHTERLRVASEKLAALEQQLPSGTDAQLRHFLQRRSYSKALDHLATLEGGR